MSSPNFFSEIPSEVMNILTVEQKAQLFDIVVEQSSQPITPIEPQVILTRGKDKQPRVSKKGYHKNVPVWEMRKFKQYSSPRVYNEKTGMWRTKRSGQRGRPLYLPFESLIIIINDYKNGIHPKETHRKLNLHTTLSGFRTTQYVYRAGGFNDGIFEHARKYGYNPQDLISRECEHIGGK